MLYQRISEIPDKSFPTLYGSKAQHIQCNAENNQSCQTGRGKGRPSKLSNADKLLVMLMYYREHRSILHISHTCSLNEVQTWENLPNGSIIIKSKKFRLPGKKHLLDNVYIYIFFHAIFLNCFLKNY